MQSFRSSKHSIHSHALRRAGLPRRSRDRTAPRIHTAAASKSGRSAAAGMMMRGRCRFVAPWSMAGELSGLWTPRLKWSVRAGTFPSEPGRPADARLRTIACTDWSCSGHRCRARRVKSRLGSCRRSHESNLLAPCPRRRAGSAGDELGIARGMDLQPCCERRSAPVLLWGLLHVQSRRTHRLLLCGGDSIFAGGAAARCTAASSPGLGGTALRPGTLHAGPADEPSRVGCLHAEIRQRRAPGKAAAQRPVSLATLAARAGALCTDRFDG